MWEKINQWAKEWGELPTEGNEARKKALENNIFTKLYLQISDKQQQAALGEFFLEDWKRFDPNKSSFRTFFKVRIAHRKTDVYWLDRDWEWVKTNKKGEDDSQNQDEKKTTKEEFSLSNNAPITGWDGDEIDCGDSIPDAYTDDAYEQDEKMTTKKRSLISINAPVVGKDGNEMEYGDSIPDAHTDDAYEAVELDAQTYEFISMILELPNRLNGKANNPERINYFRMFFTDNVSNSLRTDDLKSFRRYERELLRAMKMSLLDYIYLEKCRSIQDIIEATIKLYGAVVDGREMKPMKQPLPNDVYTTYLFEIEKIGSKNGCKLGESTISNQRTAYKDFLRQNLHL